MNEEAPRSLSQNNASVPSPALIVGAKVALNPEGKLDEAEWKAFAERLSMYSDKRYETARYFFVKDGAIVRQVAVSSQTPSATLAFPDEGYHWKLREWALESGAKIVFCHNHPSGYTAPSEADERLTSRLSNFFNGDGEEVFLGHVILDHGSFGLYTPESGWKHFGPRGLEDFGKDEGGFFIRNWVPDLSRKGSFFPVANERGLLLLAEKARELDALDSWNSKDWVPAILASKGGEIRSMEYVNVAEFKAPDLLLSRMKEAGRLHGAGDLYLFPTNWGQAMLCRSFAAETNAVRGVCRLSESGEPDVSFNANAELFGAPKKSEIIVEDTEKMPEAKARLENAFAKNQEDNDGEKILKNEKMQSELSNSASRPELSDLAKDVLINMVIPASLGIKFNEKPSPKDMSKLDDQSILDAISETRKNMENAKSDYDEENYPYSPDDFSALNEIERLMERGGAREVLDKIYNNNEQSSFREENIEENKGEKTMEEKTAVANGIGVEGRRLEAKAQATNYVLEKIQKAGIEVVTDKAEFDRILEGQAVLQKMTEDLSEFENLAAKLEKEKSITQNIQNEKKPLEEKKEEIRRKNYNEFVEFVKSTEKFIPASEFQGFSHLSDVKNPVLIVDKDKYASIPHYLAFQKEGSSTRPVIIYPRAGLEITPLDSYDNVKHIHGFKFEDNSLLNTYKENLAKYLERKILLEQQNQNKLLSQIGELKSELVKDSLSGESLDSDFARLDKSLRFNANFEIQSEKLGEDVSVFPGSTGKNGLGIRHIIEERFIKDNLSQDEIAALSALILETVRNGEITRNSENRCEFSKNGIIAIVRKDFDNRRENWILTGFHYSGEDEKKNREATEAIKTVIANYGQSEGYSYFRSQVGAVIASLDSSIAQNGNLSTPKIQKMTSSEYYNKEVDAFVTDKSGFVDPEKIAAIDLYGFEKAKEMWKDGEPEWGVRMALRDKAVSDYLNQKRPSIYNFQVHDTVYGFAHEGKIYLNPDVMNSEAAVHEYTHLWDAYTQKTNPELWRSGMNIFKGTSVWNEVLGDPNYGDIAVDDDLVLSEVHARICGKMADAVLQRIAEKDGELKKDAAIDWDREVSEFVAKEFGAVPELGQKDHVSETVRAELLKEFLSSPMKDLMAGLQITKSRETSGPTKEETVETEEDKLMAKKEEKAPARRKARKPEETAAAPEAKAEAAPAREGFKDEEASAEALYADFVEKMREGLASMKEKEEKGEEPEYASFAALFEGVGKSYSKAARVAISKKVAELAGTESPAQAIVWLENEISSGLSAGKDEASVSDKLEEPAPAVQKSAAPVPEQEGEPGVDALKKLLLEERLRNDALNAKVSSLESVIKGLQSQLAQLNAKLGAEQGREKPSPVQENASAAESGYGAPAQGQQPPSPDPNQFSTQTMYRPGIPVPKFGVKVGEDEFDIKEGCRFKELLKNKDNPAMNEVVLERETPDGTIEKVKIPEREYIRIASVHEKFEREKSQYAGDSYEWDYFHKKYGEEMGVDRNRTRMNTAANFLHNFKVWCRAEAENPQDAMRIARDLVNGMNEWEKRRFNLMRNQWPAGGEDYDKMLVHVFEENSKLKGAAITADRRPGGPAEASMIYELNKDDIQLKKGELIPGTNKRVGETVKLAMKFTSLEGRTVATPQMTFEIVGCSKNLGERNTIILANREKNTRYEVPLDPVREKIIELEKSQKKELKREAAKAKKNALSLSENFESERKAQADVSAAYGGRGM